MAKTSNSSLDDAEDAGIHGSLLSSSVFHGLLMTQFLGAFNDNYFKQMVLLKCAELGGANRPGAPAASGSDLQPLAMAVFALPFVLLSGFGGFLSDRFSRRSVIVLCKVGEIVVMLCALQVLLMGNLSDRSQVLLLIGVLGLMASQSAIFGPSKYGILPELFPGKRLLQANGAIQMTTFLSIIFGMAVAGIALDLLDDSLWMCSVLAVGLAVTGTLTSLLIPFTSAASPDLKFRPENLFVPRDARTLLRSNRPLRQAILATVTFWFIGGVAHPAVNTLGENVLSLSRTGTSLMAAAIGVGIALGCVVSGFLNRGETDGAQWVRRGGWMIVGSLVLISVLASGVLGRPTVDPAVRGILKSLTQADFMEWCLRMSMMLLGFSAGIFVVPIQVFIQETPPESEKGRMIGVQNFLTWIGILLSALFLAIMNVVIGLLSADGIGYGNRYFVFVALAVVMMPVAVFYRLHRTVES